jgi:hypothetical protein
MPNVITHQEGRCKCYLFTPPKWIEHVTQSAYAAAFCANLDSAGRYAGILKELVVVDPAKADEPLSAGDHGLKIEREVRLPIVMPNLTPEQVRAWLDVRQLAAGQQLRAALRTTAPDWAGEDNSVQFAWREVAELLASIVVSAHSVSITGLMATAAKELIKGFMMRSVPLAVAGKAFDAPGAIFAAIVAAGVEAVYHGTPLLQKAYERDTELERVRRSLTSACNVRCVKVGIAPFTIWKQQPSVTHVDHGGGPLPTELL